MTLSGEWVEIVKVGEPKPPVELEIHEFGGGDVEEAPLSVESEPDDGKD